MEAESPLEPAGVLHHALPDERTRRRWSKTWRWLVPYARKHRRPFALGACAAIAVVGFRLLLPWPLRMLFEPWLGQSGATGAATVWWQDPWVLAAGFLVSIAGLGLAEYQQRLQVARFSIGWVRDIRAAAYEAARDMRADQLPGTSGDLVARLVGDTARLKAGLKGFLVHVATNGMQFVGVVIIFLWIDLGIGGVFAVGGALVAFATLVGATRVFHRYLKLRKKEGRLAENIRETLDEGEEDDDFAGVNYSSGRHEASVVRIQGQTTIAAHFIIGASTLAAMGLGVRGLEAGTIRPGELFIFVSYALMLHRPAVRLARQGTRTGKMLACGYRLERVLAAGRRARKEAKAERAAARAAAKASGVAQQAARPAQ